MGGHAASFDHAYCSIKSNLSGIHIRGMTHTGVGGMVSVSNHHPPLPDHPVLGRNLLWLFQFTYTVQNHVVK